MALITQAKNLTLGEVHRKLNLHKSRDAEFFHEWRNINSSLSEADQENLQQLRDDLESMQENPSHEEIVKIFALGPILRLAGMAKYPFLPKAEHIIEIDMRTEIKRLSSFAAELISSSLTKIFGRSSSKQSDRHPALLKHSPKR